MQAKPPVITHRKCFNHGLREAVARCPDCGRYFCRECVTEHEYKVICASCLEKLQNHTEGKPSTLNIFMTLIRFSSGFIMLWIFFYFLGKILLKMPVAFHDGTIWDIPW